MERADAISQLPASHAVAIRLRDEGADAHLIAVALGVEDDEVPVMLSIADAKLTTLLSNPRW